jgi:hypothetical protein
MLHDLDLLDQRTGGKASEDLPSALRLLLRSQFLFSGDRGFASAYNTLTNPRYRDFIEDWLDVLGLTFVQSVQDQWVGVLPQPDIPHMPTMSLTDTLVLLVVAQAWQEAANGGDFGARAVVHTTVNRVWDQYDTLRPRLRGGAMTITEFERSLKELQRRNIVDLKDMDEEVEDRDLEIRPMVTHLLRDGEALRILEDYCRSEEGILATWAPREEDAARDGEGDGETEDNVNDPAKDEVDIGVTDEVDNWELNA